MLVEDTEIVETQAQESSVHVSAVNFVQGKDWSIYHGDCCEVLSDMPDDSIGYSVFSPPFASLFVYSDSERDMGNCESDESFFDHFSFLVDQLYRVIQPGRLVSIHCMNLPSTITSDGYIGIRDFRGEIIRAMSGNEAGDIARSQRHLYRRMVQAREDGNTVREKRIAEAIDSINIELAECPPDKNRFIYHSEVCIWKDPVTAMQRTKALGLLHKQVVKDSTMSRQGIPDYVCTFRKPGKNANPIAGEFDHFVGEGFKRAGNLSIDIWQRYASPVWMDINQSRTLNARAARDKDDTRHICPLQLDVIHRCLQLWSKPGDIVLSPFAGIGSEGFESISLWRKFVGIELKDSYFEQAVKNLTSIEKQMGQSVLPGMDV